MSLHKLVKIIGINIVIQLLLKVWFWIAMFLLTICMNRYEFTMETTQDLHNVFGNKFRKQIELIIASMQFVVTENIF